MNLKRLAILSAAIPFALAGCAAATNSSTPLPGSAGGLNWVRYTDSAEGAFSIDVPLGWQVLGGMYRMGFLDVRWMIDVRSLDGKVILRINDPNVPPYALARTRVRRATRRYARRCIKWWSTIIARRSPSPKAMPRAASQAFANPCLRGKAIGLL